MGFVWHTTPERAWGGLADEYARAIEDGVFALAQQYAIEIEAWMKDNAPWTDQTGNARQTMAAEAERLVGAAAQIILSYGVEYGLYLELSNGGAFSIIGPALDTFVPRVWADVQELLR